MLLGVAWSGLQGLVAVCKLQGVVAKEDNRLQSTAAPTHHQPTQSRVGWVILGQSSDCHSYDLGVQC